MIKFPQYSYPPHAVDHLFYHHSCVLYYDECKQNLCTSTRSPSMWSDAKITSFAGLEVQCTGKSSCKSNQFITDSFYLTQRNNFSSGFYVDGQYCGKNGQYTLCASVFNEPNRLCELDVMESYWSNGDNSKNIQTNMFPYHELYGKFYNWQHSKAVQTGVLYDHEDSKVDLYAIEAAATRSLSDPLVKCGHPDFKGYTPYLSSQIPGMDCRGTEACPSSEFLEGIPSQYHAKTCMSNPRAVFFSALPFPMYDMSHIRSLIDDTDKNLSDLKEPCTPPCIKLCTDCRMFEHPLTDSCCYDNGGICDSPGYCRHGRRNCAPPKCQYWDSIDKTIKCEEA